MPATLATTVMKSTNASSAASGWDTYLAELLGTDLKVTVNGAAPLLFGLTTIPIAGTVGPLMESMSPWAAIDAIELNILDTFMAATAPAIVAESGGAITVPGTAPISLRAYIIAAGLSAYTSGTPLDSVMLSWVKTISWVIIIATVAGTVMLV